jgi:hypothetical protein
LTPTLPSPELASVRVPGISLSDRLLQKLKRLVVGRPYFSGSIVVHAALALVFLNVAAFDARKSAQVAAAQAAQDAQRVARTQARDLQHRVERMTALLAELAPTAKALPPATADSSPEALAQRAQQLADAIDAADREARAADLSRLTQLSLDEARRKIAQETVPARAVLPETAARKIVRLEHRAREIAEARRARLDAQREGLRVTSTHAHAKAQRLYAPDAALAHTTPASGSTGQAHVADGIPRSAAEQFAAMVRLGGPQGRVGVVGTEAGLSVNREHVKGLAGGRNATAQDFGRDSDKAAKTRSVVIEGQSGKSGRNGGVGENGSGETKNGSRAANATAPAAPQGLSAVRIAGSSLDLTGRGEDGHHELVRYAQPPAVDMATLHTAAGRVFGAGGTYAERIYLDTWYVIGPFEGRGDESMHAAYPPEDAVDLDAAYPGPEGRTLTWQFTSRGFYPFIPPDRRANAVYYAYTELRVDDDRDVWIAIAADDDSMMWIDERLVWVSEPGDKPWYHPPYYLRDELVGSLSLAEGQRRVHLTAGVHRLLFKLYNDSDRTFFSVVLTK